MSIKLGQNSESATSSDQPTTKSTAIELMRLEGHSLQNHNRHRGIRISEAMAIRKFRYNCQLCYDLGVTESSLSRWRSGNPISTANAIKLCILLDISIEWLIFGEIRYKITCESHYKIRILQDCLSRLDDISKSKIKHLIRRLLVSSDLETSKTNDW